MLAQFGTRRAVALGRERSDLGLLGAKWVAGGFRGRLEHEASSIPHASGGVKRRSLDAAACLLRRENGKGVDGRELDGMPMCAS